jgi:DNA replication protein DnaC
MEELKQIGTVLQQMPAGPEPSVNQCKQLDYILTEEERNMVVDYFINLAKQSKYKTMIGTGMHPQTAIQKLSEIDWNEEIDIETIVAEANQRKHWQIEDLKAREEKRRQAEEQREQLLSTWKAKTFYNLIKFHFMQLRGEFIRNEHNDTFIKAICYFLSSDPRFETDLNFSFNKGLMIIGESGTGKTEVIRAVANNPLWPIIIHSIIDIVFTVKQIGECEINTDQLLMIDDIGTETEALNHYGTKINWFKDFIETYYLKYRSYNGLIITTNLGGAQIEARYGYRVRSRLREMFNVIELTGKDLRK